MKKVIAILTVLLLFGSVLFTTDISVAESADTNVSGNWIAGDEVGKNGGRYDLYDDGTLKISGFDRLDRDNMNDLMYALYYDTDHTSVDGRDIWCEREDEDYNTEYYTNFIKKIIIEDGIKTLETKLEYAIAGSEIIYFTNIQEVCLPDTLTAIGSYAFSNCKKLKTVNVPEGVTSIGERTFSNCISLTAIELPSTLSSIGYYAFGECSQLKSVSFPESLTKIGNRAFYDCGKLASINLPSGLESIGNWAFAWCPIKSVVYPDSLVSVGEGAFSGAESIYIPDSLDATVKTISYGRYVDLWSKGKTVPTIDVYYGGPEEGFNLICSDPGYLRKLYCGISYEQYLEMKNKEVDSVDFSKLSMFLSYSKVKYNGKAKKPNVAVFDRTKRIKAGTDYTVSYKNNVKGGKATVTAIGKGKYHGTLKKTFIIKRARPYLRAKNITKLMKFKKYKFKIKVRTNSNARLKYKSSNKKIKVNSRGVVTVSKNFYGKATIKITAPKTRCYYAKKKTIRIKIKKPKLKKKYYSIYRGKKVQIRVLNNSTKAKGWKTTNSSVATVSSNGNVKAKGFGTCYIKCKVGTVTLKCKIRVRRAKMNFAGIIDYYDTRGNTFWVKYHNEGEKTITIKSGIKVYDDDYTSFDRNIYITKSVKIRPWRTKSVAFHVKGSTTWYDERDFDLDYYFIYDGLKYHGSSRADGSWYKTGGRWKNTWKHTESMYEWFSDTAWY
ncbi:MAG: leucine-rich repeat protein [Bacillota bacterium]|nr:leucine-rich repeat protein [Bacillota bacterium]